MTPDPASDSDRQPVDPPPSEIVSDGADADNYDPGETLGRAMNLGCSFILIALALVSCGFIVSVFTLHR